MARPLLLSSLVGLTAGLAVAFSGTAVPDPRPIWAAHSGLLLYGFLLPACAWLLFHLLDRHVGLRLADRAAAILGQAWLLAGAAAALAALVPADTQAGVWARFAAGLVALVAGVAQMLAVTRLLPRASVVDVAARPLSKGDDACLAQVRFSHRFLPFGLLLLAVAPILPTAWVAGVHLAGLHVLLAGALLLSVYGASHLVVPRLSGIPAIAAGAIKGELHTSLLGVTLLGAGFVLSPYSWHTGLVIAGGLFVFFAAFVFMGVLGANIMKNKSRTQRVTPEFVYVPWTFAGTFWLIAGVLLGVFLNAVPAEWADRRAGLAFAHAHAILLGGAAFLVLGYALRVLPAAHGRDPPAFQLTKGAFLALNVGLALVAYAGIQDQFGSWTARVGCLLMALGLAAWFMTLRRHVRAW